MNVEYRAAIEWAGMSEAIILLSSFKGLALQSIVVKMHTSHE